ncbi:MAG: DUF2490 domain-containing protein [Bacteroidia bacterium]|nr:DUF2490 domain-containing protein [Bacteroidia bacterium]
MGNWVIYISQVKLGKKGVLWNECQWRNGELFQPDLNQLLLRYGIGIQHSQSIQSIMGYAFIHNRNSLPVGTINYFNEHRLFQQFIFLFKIQNLMFQNRFRLEERFMQNHPLQFRFRYFAYIMFPLISRDFGTKTFYFSSYNEIFILPFPFNFDRNRFYAAFGYYFNPNLRIEAGIMNQMTGLHTEQKQAQLAVFHNFKIHRDRVKN